MIRIHKRTAVPTALARRGGVATAALVRKAQAGAVDFTFRSSLYGHATVKEALFEAQHDKCAFCESKIRDVAYGDVEHFRPKAAVEVGGALVKPGYFWLAYEWDNLYVSCQICNQQHKRNAFPVAGPRATRQNPDLRAEQAVFIDPGHEEPSDHIEFIDSAAHGRTARGQATVGALGLNRSPLDDSRRTLIKLHRALLDALEPLMDRNDAIARNATQAILDNLCAAMQDDAEYAAMSRCLIRAHPLAARILAAC